MLVIHNKVLHPQVNGSGQMQRVCHEQAEDHLYIFGQRLDLMDSTFQQYPRLKQCLHKTVGGLDIGVKDAERGLTQLCILKSSYDLQTQNLIGNGFNFSSLDARAQVRLVPSRTDDDLDVAGGSAPWLSG